MAQHLLVAADRFQLPRLRRICERRLCETVEVFFLCIPLFRCCSRPDCVALESGISMRLQMYFCTLLGPFPGMPHCVFVVGSGGPRPCNLCRCFDASSAFMLFWLPSACCFVSCSSASAAAAASSASAAPALGHSANARQSAPALIGLCYGSNLAITVMRFALNRGP